MTDFLLMLQEAAERIFVGGEWYERGPLDAIPAEKVGEYRSVCRYRRIQS